jgi:hypothetical protein
MTGAWKTIVYTCPNCDYRKKYARPPKRPKCPKCKRIMERGGHI